MHQTVGSVNGKRCFVMPMTMTQKILARAAGLENVKPGQLIQAKVDMVLGNDITARWRLRNLKKPGWIRYLIPIKLHLYPITSHRTRISKSAEQVKLMREFARKKGIKNFSR
jgi:3-isopropylmalate/(R)-2-methylmalate dehydratase large subunit